VAAVGEEGDVCGEIFHADAAGREAGRCWGEEVMGGAHVRLGGEWGGRPRRRLEEEK